MRWGWGYFAMKSHLNRFMKNSMTSHNWAVGLLALVAIASSFSATAAPTPPIEWPRVIYRNSVTNTIYQPQLVSWDYYTLQAVSAVALQAKGAPQPTFGTISLTIRTRVDRAEREVFFEDVKITQGLFPSAPDKANSYLVTLRSLLPKEVKSIALDRLEASLAVLQARQKASGQPLRNDPPTVLFSTKPAMQVPVEGQPVYRPVEKTELERVFNTRALILRDKTGKHYLHLYDGYAEAASLSGPWTVCEKVPSDVTKAEKQAVAAKQVDLLAGQENPETKKKPSIKSTPVPEIRVTTAPTELILIQGEPQWSPIPPTQLLYVTNTVANVFKLLDDQKTYVLLSGRWFRSSSFDGPWEYVSATSLPSAFENIPDSSPKENVKASVPGTRQAQEALIANGIPQTVKVDRKKARMDPPPQYDGGAPQLRPIDGTPLQYVANTPVPVIRVESKSWFACQNGVWFTAPSANGPWEVAIKVPAVIYSIPPSSPVYYVVFSRIYNYDLDYVWVGTTPGYYGTVVSPDGVVVYGTGYIYPPYVGETIYVSYAVTYGYGSSPCWTPWAGWAFGFAVGWAMTDDWYWWSYCPPCPYWGGYWYSCYGAYYNAYGGITAWGPYGWAGTSGYIYHQNGPWTGVSRSAAGYNAWTGNQWATSYGRAYNSTTGTRVVGKRGAVENVYTGNYAYGGRGAAYNENTGAAAVGRKITVGNENTGNQGSAGRATIYNPNTGNATTIGGIKGEDGGVVNINGHVIAGKDGNYYRPDGSGGWQQVSRPSGGASAMPANANVRAQQQINQTRQWQQSNVEVQQRQALNNELSARQVGAVRQQSFQMNRPAFRGGGGGGRRR
jgi:hypothetical protein